MCHLRDNLMKPRGDFNLPLIKAATGRRCST